MEVVENDAPAAAAAAAEAPAMKTVLETLLKKRKCDEQYISFNVCFMLV